MKGMRPHVPALFLRIILPGIILATTFLWIYESNKSTSKTQAMETESSRFSYVSGYFKHDLQPTGPEEGFRAKTLPGFGILDRTYEIEDNLKNSMTQWQRFERFIKHLNEANADGTQYKVIFVARHGEGVHNVKEKQVGRHEWERYWSRLEGDSYLTWLDAHLTPQGIREAESLGEFWRNAFDIFKVPSPDNYYTSPLARCLETVYSTFSKVQLPEGRQFRPVVKEALREIFGVHTCDRRSSRSWIRTNFPDCTIEPGFTETDELWTSDRRETLQEHTALMRRFLTGIFEDDSGTFISITTHSGAIRALYLAVGHPDVWVAPGAVVPVVIRGERNEKGNSETRGQR